MRRKARTSLTRVSLGTTGAGNKVRMLQDGCTWVTLCLCISGSGTVASRPSSSFPTRAHHLRAKWRACEFSTAGGPWCNLIASDLVAYPKSDKLSSVHVLALCPEELCPIKERGVEL